MEYTIKDVAKKANVSIATVSRIVNNQTGFSEKTKRKVLDVIEELGYQPNAVARGLINKRTHTIGVLFPKFSGMLVTEFLSGIEKAANEQGSSVIVCHTESNGEKTMKYLQLLNEKRIDGIIFTSEVLKDEYYQYIKKMKVPMVLLSTESYVYPVPYVKVNDRHAAYTATQYLIQKGHKKIAMISGNKDDIIAGKPRIDGYINAMTDNGLPVNDKYIINSKSFAFQDGVEGLEALMRQAPGVTAVFAASDEIAIGALSKAYQLGIKVPDDLSIIGYDNLSIAEMSAPPLTSVAQPLAEMGEMATKMLFEMMETGQSVESRIMPHQIIERNSV
ncbi:LacI family transcriptional regulator [Bacillus canaveralius]|uniref:Catabolite control protein A n=1 Tax=Bacillus canaveralius TaxID=1403243 RepID=A0A2N5GM27_9BACI|nr:MULTISPECIES: LacI family DNA-binding transcriptional regulator [Bacillus]PLR82920.1 LacI family transcriptional regulator [Bacillus canaveralius]PLR85292.1 LacI family transcriptional regulator [Bacillus sp. V33-4]PLR97075.1 LacI family transcriptional regulator [Bacillus canaveralius]RSK47849.1 LacI family transcriptional regulator [Bacillus canaveralius]